MGKIASTTVAMGRRGTDRIPFVEGLRGFCALYVVLGHLCSMSDPSTLVGKVSTSPVWFQRLIAPFAYGHLAVAAFIVISGFCLQLSLFASGEGRIKSAKRFFVRRARRILPAYYGCLAVSIAVAILVTPKLPGKNFELYLPVTWQNVLAHVFMVHNLYADWMYKLNGVLWSIAIEAQLYLVFPLLVASLFRIGRWWTVAAASAAAIAILMMAPESTKLYPWYLPLFVLGMAGAHLAYRPHPRIGLRAGIARMLGGLAVIGCAIGLGRGWAMPVTDAMIGLGVASLCYYGSVSRPTAFVRFLSTKPLLALGAFSYSLYLMHHPVQQVLFKLRPAWIAGSVAELAYLVAMLPLIVGFAWAFSLIFERPFLGKVSRVDPRTEFVPLSLPLLTASAAPRRPILHRPVEIKVASGATAM